MKTADHLTEDKIFRETVRLHPNTVNAGFPDQRACHAITKRPPPKTAPKQFDLWRIRIARDRRCPAFRLAQTGPLTAYSRPEAAVRDGFARRPARACRQGKIAMRGFAVVDGGTLIGR